MKTESPEGLNEETTKVDHSFLSDSPHDGTVSPTQGDPPCAYVTLDQLIKARRERRSDCTELAELTTAFEQRHGKILKEYFCSDIEGAAVLTQRPMESKWPLVAQLRQAREAGKLKVLSWLTTDPMPGDMHLHARYPRAAISSVSPEFEEALWRCEDLSARANQLLRTKNSQMIHLKMNSLLFYLLSVLNTLAGQSDQKQKDERIQKALRRANAELDATEEIYASCAVWGAQLAYSRGMLYGILGLLALETALFAATLNLSDESFPDLERFLIGLGAGGVGAIVSVMQRMSSNHLKLNVLAEHKSLSLVGSFRPIIGALFGAAFIVLLTAGLLNIAPVGQTPPRTMYFLAGLAFLAGFSERFVQVALGGVTREALRSTATEERTARADERKSTGPNPARTA